MIAQTGPCTSEIKGCENNQTFSLKLGQRNFTIIIIAGLSGRVILTTNNAHDHPSTRGGVPRAEMRYE